MRPALSQFTKVIQESHIPAAFKPDRIRGELRRKCKGVLAVTTQFLRSLISESDQTHAGSTATNRSSRHSISSLPESIVLLPWMDRGMNAVPFAAQKRRSARRRAEVLGMKNPYSDMAKNDVAQYPVARDIRPLQSKPRPLCTLLKKGPFEIARREGRIMKVGSREERRPPKSRSRNSNKKEDLNVFVIPPSVRLKRKIQSNNRLIGVAARNDEKFARADWRTKLRGKSVSVFHSRRIEEDVTGNCIKYEHTVMEPPVCQKRRRGITIKRNIEEPEHKLRRLGWYSDT